MGGGKLTKLEAPKSETAREASLEKALGPTEMGELGKGLTAAVPALRYLIEATLYVN